MRLPVDGCNMLKLMLITALLLGSLAASLATRIPRRRDLDRIQNGGEVAIYWGQFTEEGSLRDVCSTGRYDIIMISFLSEFGRGKRPSLNLAGHCDTTTRGGCAQMQNEIQDCQDNGVKIFLSIGGATNTYRLDSKREAKSIAKFIWNNFLGGQSDDRPFGSAVLDGVDFDLEQNEIKLYDILAVELRNCMDEDGSKTFHLSAAPQCPFQDASLGPGPNTALGTGLFDFVWVQFYNNPECQYHPDGEDVRDLIKSWNTWTSALPDSKIFMGLPASVDAASGSPNINSGFIPSNVLVSKVLPKISESKNFGGIMFWSAFHDKISDFELSEAVRNSIRVRLEE